MPVASLPKMPALSPELSLPMSLPLQRMTWLCCRVHGGHGLSKNQSSTRFNPWCQCCPECPQSVCVPPVIVQVVSTLKHRLSPQRPEHASHADAAVRPDCPAEVHFVSHGPFGILDLGASQTVIGNNRFKRFFKVCLPKLPRGSRKSRAIPFSVLETTVQWIVSMPCLCLLLSGTWRFVWWIPRLHFCCQTMCFVRWGLKLKLLTILCFSPRSTSGCLWSCRKRNSIFWIFAHLSERVNVVRSTCGWHHSRSSGHACSPSISWEPIHSQRLWGQARWGGWSGHANSD